MRLALHDVVPSIPLQRGVYRSARVVRGLVTYFAVTSMGAVLDDELRAVRRGTVTEALSVARLRRLLNEHDPAGPSLRLIHGGASEG